MIRGSKSGSACAQPIACPLLVECDSLGRVLWMSERARSIFGDTEYLTGAIATSLRFWRVWESPGSVLLGAQASDPGQESGERDTSELLRLQGSLLRHYFQLQILESRLAARVRPVNGSSGSRAVRQVELERQRLGRELHTGVGQMLAAIRMQLETVSRVMPAPQGLAQLALDRIATLSVDAMEQVRSLSQRLHPPEWQRLTLEVALQQLWELSGAPERYEASLRIGPLPRQPELEVKVLLYRAFQEVLSNLARHSGATSIAATLETCGQAIVLSIQDNGIGFDVARLLAAPAHVAAGIGLRSIRELTEGIGGRFQIESSPAGTKVVVSIAYSPAEA